MSNEKSEYQKGYEAARAAFDVATQPGHGLNYEGQLTLARDMLQAGFSRSEALAQRTPMILDYQNRNESTREFLASRKTRLGKPTGKGLVGSSIEDDYARYRQDHGLTDQTQAEEEQVTQQTLHPGQFSVEILKAQR